MILCYYQINDSFFVHNLAGLHWGSFCNKSQVCAMLWGLDDMHASLPDVKYRPPLWWSIVIGCLCLHSQAFFVLSMHWLIHVLAIHSVVSAVHILGCLRRLLLLLFITWLCPQVWCCLIHREGFSLLDPSKNYPLAVKKAHRCKLNVLLHGFLSFYRIRLWKKCSSIINDVHFITHIHAMKCVFELQNRWSHS